LSRDEGDEGEGEGAGRQRVAEVGLGSMGARASVGQWGAATLGDGASGPASVVLTGGGGAPRELDAALGWAGDATQNGRLAQQQFAPPGLIAGGQRDASR
jgi:hypothetical protein